MMVQAKIVFAMAEMVVMVGYNNANSGEFDAKS